MTLVETAGAHVASGRNSSNKTPFIKIVEAGSEIPFSVGANLTVNGGSTIKVSSTAGKPFLSFKNKLHRHSPTPLNDEAVENDRLQGGICV